MAVWDVYVGTFTKEWAAVKGTPAEGIERFHFDDATGEISFVDITSGLLSPQYLARHPSLQVLYAAEDESPGGITTFSIAAGGTLDPVARVSTSGDWPAHMSVHPSGRHAYTANYRSGGIAAFPIDTAGTVAAADAVVNHEGRGRGDTKRNEMSHPHYIRPTPDGRHLLVCDVGLDILFCYETTSDGALASTPPLQIEFPPVSAPRHLEFDPSGRYVYVNGETDSMLYVLEAEEGVPTKIVGSVPCAPPGYEGHNSPTELMLHPDGRTLYLASRGSNTVTIFDVDNSTGQVKVLGHADTLDGGPRGLRVDPSGRFVVVANTEPASIVVFRIGADRLLEPVGTPLPCHAPSSLLFLEA